MQEGMKDKKFRSLEVRGKLIALKKASLGVRSPWQEVTCLTGPEIY